MLALPTNRVASLCACCADSKLAETCGGNSARREKPARTCNFQRMMRCLRPKASWYSTNLTELPTSCCQSCQLNLRLRKKDFSPRFNELRQVLSESSRISRAPCSDSQVCLVFGDSCYLCSRRRIQHPFKSDSPPPSKTEISPHKRRKRTVIVRTVKASPERLIVADLLAMQREMRVSSRTIARGAEKQKARAASGLTAVFSSSGSVLRKQNTEINKAFWDDFEAIPCPYSSDGYLYRVKNCSQWVRKVLWIRGKEVRVRLDAGE